LSYHISSRVVGFLGTTSTPFLRLGGERTTSSLNISWNVANFGMRRHDYEVQSLWIFVVSELGLKNFEGNLTHTSSLWHAS